MMDELGFGDLASPLPVDGPESHLFSLFLHEDLHQCSSDSSSPPSVPSDSQTSSPVHSPIPSAPGDEFGINTFGVYDASNSTHFGGDLFKEDLSSESVWMKQEPACGVKQEQEDSSSESDDSAPPSPKRKRKNKRNFSTMEASAELCREELRNMTSKELQEYSDKLAALRPLSKGEERALKRQRRLVKNRESAQLSRARKKMYVEELERKVNMVSVHSERMAVQMQHLSSENKRLKEELYHLRASLKHHAASPAPSAEEAAGGVTNAAAVGCSPDLCAAPTASPLFAPLGADALPGALGAKQLRLLPQVRTAGMCLFIILLSFGVFFSASSLGTRGPALPPIAVREAVPEVMPQAMRRGFTGRTLKAVEESAVSVGGAVQAAVLAEKHGGARGRANEKHAAEIVGDEALMVVEEVVEEVVEVAMEATDVSPAPLLSARSSAASSAVTVSGGAAHSHAASVLCSEAHNLRGSAWSAAEDADTWQSGEGLFTIVLPPRALVGAVPNVDRIADGQLVEVGCRILSLDVLPASQRIRPVLDAAPERVAMSSRLGAIGSA